MIWHAEWAWLGGRAGDAGGVQPDVLLEADGATLTRVESGAPAPAGAVRLAGVTLPGLVNAHSHAFHRAMRARSQRGAGDFWAWRDQMYALAARLDPDRYHDLARACFAEMALAGITTVGEFHYLHHAPGGRPYADPNAMAEALRAAASSAGIRLTLLDTLYLRAGFDPSPDLDPVQQRFSDGDAEQWATRVESLAATWTGDGRARVGAAIHSVRAVGPDAAKAAVDYAASAGSPLHVHVSEQPAEDEACRAAHGCSPTELLARVGALGERTTAVHATHATDRDLDILAEQGSAVCLCPTTERDLADGVGRARRMAAAGIRLALGSDSHAIIDLFEEARLAELHERLVSGSRAGLRADELLVAATEAGAACLGWPEAGQLAPGRSADLTTVSLESGRLAGIPADDLAAGLVFAATAADVTDVVVGGRAIVRNGRHLLVDDVPAALAAALSSLDEAAPA